jgi:hypothetical protein
MLRHAQHERTAAIRLPLTLSLSKGERSRLNDGAGRARRAAAAVATVALALALAACATYIDRVQHARGAAASGDYEAAIAALNEVLDVGSADELPDTWGGNRALAVLERAVLQQALTRYRTAARDLSAAEQELELLDLKNDAVGSLGRYLYSDSVTAYKTPPSERLALNAINLLNYLAVGDLDGAAVEARRFQVMREYLASVGITAAEPAALGTYLAGFVFECRGEGDRALRYYDETLAHRPLASLAAPVARLARVYPYRGAHLTDLLARQPSADGARPRGELLVALGLGRVPHRVPERMPVGLAIGLAGAYITDDVDYLKYGAAKVVVYPELTVTPSALGPPTVQVDGTAAGVEELVDLGAAVRAEYEAAKPKILAAALTRLATRAAVAEGVRAAGNRESNLLGDLLALFTEGALVALDRPDTRSWTMLPERVLVARLPVTPGPHAVEVHFGGAAGRRTSVTVPENGYAAVVVTEPR